MEKENQNNPLTKSSFIKYFKRWGLFFLVSLASILIVYEIVSSKWDFDNRVEKLRQDYVEKQKELIKHEVNHVIDMVNFRIANLDEQIRTRLKTRVYEGYSIADDIYKSFNGIKTKGEIEDLIINVLRQIKFEKGDGYYFIADLNGNVKLHGGRKDFEETNQLKSGDLQSRKIVQEMIRIVREKGEGYYEYLWEKPHEKGKYEKKTSFVKYFKPFNWYIGTGVYVDDLIKNIQDELLKEIGKIRFGQNKEGYIFVVAQDGTTLMNDTQPEYIGKNILELSGPKGNEIIEKERAAAKKPDGDFIYYSFNKPPSNEIKPKVSFVKGIDKWKWMVGAGVYLDDVENEIAAMRSDLREQILLKVFNSALIVLIILSLFLYLFNILARKLNADFQFCNESLKNASISNNPVDVDRLQFQEIERLASAANEMLYNKISAEQEVAEEKEQLYVTLRSIGDGLITTDKSGKVQLLNTIAEKLTGWTTSEAQGKPLSEVFKILNKDTKEPLFNPVERVLEKGETVELADHTILISRDGTEYQIADSASPIKDVLGKVRGVVLVFRDITDEYRLQEELRKNQEMNKAILDAMPDLIFVVNDKYEFVSYFAPTDDNLYINSDAFIGKRLNEMLPPDVAEKSIENINRVFNGENLVRYQYSLEMKNETKFFEARITQKSENEVLVVVRDITEIKISDDKLKETKEFAENIIDTANAIIVTLDKNATITTFNSFAEKLTGYKRDEVIGKNWFEIFIPDKEKDYVPKVFEDVVEGMLGASEVENLILTKNGNERLIRWSNNVIRDASGNITGTLSIGLDVTEEKKAEKELIAREEKFRKTFATSPDSITISSLIDGKYVSVNKGFCDALGYSENEVIGKSSLALNIWVDPDAREQLVKIIQKDGKLENFETKFKAKDGSIKVGLVSARIIELDSTPHLVTIVRDITDRKQTEEKLRKISLLKDAILESPEGIVVFALDNEYKYLDFTRSHKETMKAIWGVDIELDKCMLDYILNEEDRKKAKENFDRALSGEKFELYEEYGDERLKRLHYEDRYSPIYDEDGNIIGLSVYVIDITERRRAQQLIEEMLSEMEMQAEELKKKNEMLEDARKATINLIEDLELQIEERIKIEEELKKSEERHRLISDLTSDYLFETKVNENGSTEMVWVAGAFKEITGYTVDEYVEIGGWRATIHPDDLFLDEEAFKQIQKNEKAIVELRTYHKSGRIVWVRSLGSPLWDEKRNKLIGVVGAVKDITEEKQNQITHEIEYNIANAAVSAKTTKDLISVVRKELGQIINTKELYIAFYNMATDMFSMYVYEDSRDKIETWKAEKSVSGYVLKQGKSMLLTKDEILKLADAGEIDIIGTLPEIWFGVPLRIGTKNIGVIVTQSYDNPNAFSMSNVTALEIVANQISLFIERKRAEEDAFRLSKAIIQSPVSVVITDREGTIEYVNPKFTEITGYTLQEIIGQNPRILKSGNQTKTFYEKLWSVILSGKNWKGELLNKKKNGEMHWENVIISPIANDEGNITHFVAIKEDISEKKKMLEDLIEAKEKAEISEKIKTEFLAQMSHEIRSPLNVILNFVSLIKAEVGDDVNEDMQFGFKSIDSASQRIIRTIDLILNMTDLQSGAYEMVVREFDVAKTLDLLFSEYKHYANTKNIELQKNLKFTSYKIRSDEYAFTQIFSNLIDNAIKYTNEGSVEIKAEKKGKKLVVSVKDTGIGMSKEFLPRLFSAFTQEEQGYSRSYDGNGLGMALVKRYCDLIKAEISVKSEKGKGTTFTISIPALIKSDS